MAVRFVFKDQPDYAYVYMLYIGLGVILGHNYPFICILKAEKELRQQPVSFSQLTGD